MVNPILRKIRKPNLTSIDIADLLEKHIDDGSNRAHCKEAYEACQTIRNKKKQAVPVVINTLLKYELNYFDIVKLIIYNFRNPDNYK